MKLGVGMEFLLPFTAPGPDAERRAVVLARECGFDSIDHLPSVTDPDYLANAAAFGELLAREEMCATQTHAPYNRYNRTRTDEEFKPLLFRAVESTAALGAKYMVIHGDEYRLAPGETWDAEKVARWSVEYLKPVAEAAGKAGITLAVETLFEEFRWGEPRSRFCSTLEEMRMLLDGLRGYPVGVCWDFGHAQLAFQNDPTAPGEDSQEKVHSAFRALLPHMVATHLHDNNRKSDLHLLPTLGKQNLKPLVRELCASSYPGDLTYEMHYGTFPPALFPDFLRYAGKVGAWLLSPED